MLRKMFIIYGVQKIGLPPNLSWKVPLVDCSRLLIQYNLSYPTY